MSKANEINQYGSRLQENHNRLLDLLKNTDLPEADKVMEILSLVNDSLPISESEALARHMIRRMLCPYKRYITTLDSTMPCYALLLDGKHIEHYYNLGFRLAWDRITKKYAKYVESAEEFSHTPIYD